MPIERLLITSDLLRLYDASDRSALTKNTHWLYRLLNKQLSTATGKPVEILEWDGNNAFDGHAFYEACGHKATFDAWISLYEQTDLSDAALACWQPHLENALLIGFELSPCIMAICDTLNVPYISLLWHPVRFMDDIFFGFCTNQPDIYAELQRFQLHSSLIYAHAELYRARHLRAEPSTLAYEGIVLIGQTSIDRALIHNSRIHNMQDYAARLHELATFQTLIFRPHPFEPHVPDVINQLQHDKRAVIDRDSHCSIYELMCSEHVAELVALSSGALYEASFFEKQTERLMPQTDRFADDDTDFDALTYIPIYYEFLFAEFWAKILSPLIQTQNPAPGSVHFIANRLRHTNCSSWGYQAPELTQIVEKYK